MTGGARRGSLRCAAGVLAAAAVVAGCGGTSTTSDHKLLVVGANAIVGVGCEACHMIGAEGNPGPGPSLTTIGARLSLAEITRALDGSPSAMPSFRELPAGIFRPIVVYLASLKSRRDVITVASPNVGSGSIPLSRAVVCKNRKVLYDVVGGASDTGRSQQSAKARRAELKRAVESLCDALSRKAR